MQRSFQHSLLRARFDKPKRRFVADNRAAAERIHDDDAHVMRRRRPNPLFAVRKIDGRIAERDALEIAFFDDLPNFAARQMRRKRDVTHQPFFFRFEQFRDRSARFPARPIFQR